MKDKSSFPSSSCALWFLLASSVCTFCSSKPILCTRNERAVLLSFKNNLIDNSNRLSSWTGDDCCRWHGIVCDNFTGHVLEIRLRGPDDELHGHCHGPYDTDAELQEASKLMLGGVVSPALINLHQLRYLDLSCNDFGPTKIPAFIGSLQNLRYLNLSKSQFDGEIPHQLGNLSKLDVLDLYHGLFPSGLFSKNLKWLNYLKGLQYLNMGGIDLSGASHWLQVIDNLPSLLELHLSLCGLTQIPNLNRVSFTSLSILDLPFNTFNSLLPMWIFSLHNLTSLVLSDCSIHGLYPGTRVGLRSMPSLRILHVSGNNFVNSSLILEGLSSLNGLVSLDISDCSVSSPVLHDLQNLTSIVHIDLSNNQIVEEIPKSLRNLCNLTTLDLQSNNFSGNVSELLESFCGCESPKLERLFSRGNNLVGQLPEKLGRLKNLVSLDLAYNGLTGTIPDSVGSLSLLNTLQLNVNLLEGLIPDSIGGLSSLGTLELSYNKLNGSLPVSIGKLRKLSFASLHHNSLTGIVTEHHFNNLTALTMLWIGDNNLVFKLNESIWIPPFQLSVLRIGSCSLGPRFPSWIRSQTNLTELDLSNSNISDTIPSWFWSTFSSVIFLNTSHNNIQGKLGNVSFLTPGAQLDLSANRFNGPLPGYYNGPDLDFLDLSSNNLSGSLNEFLCSGIQEPRLLTVLNLANNNLSGVIPNCWKSWESLIILNLETNRLSGTIPSILGNISSLKSLDLGNNMLSGELPASLLNSQSLVIIELGENELSGRIPASVGRYDTSLILLSLRSNKLEAEIPNEICGLSSLQILDLAHNHLSGSLPACFRNFSVISGRQSPSPIILYDALFQNQVLGSASLVTKGRVYMYSTNLYLVTTLDLSSNRISGSIPMEFFSLPALRYLNLSRNDLTGRIPQTIDEMRQLESLDLSRNHLNGKIPSSLSVLTSLNLLDLSYNNLTGRIPTSTQLQTMNESSFVGNALCGAPLAACQQTAVDTKGAKDEDDESNIDWILVIFTVVGLIVGFWIMIAPLLISETWRNVYYDFLHKMRMKLQDFIIVLIFNRFKRRGPLHEIQQFDTSQYNYDEGFTQRGVVHEASSSTSSV